MTDADETADTVGPLSGTSLDRTLLAVAFSLLYGLTAATHLPGGDGPLFATIFADGGSGPPPGYPLYCLYLMAMQWLPASTPVHGASLATSFLGVASVLVLHRAARAWGLSRCSAAVSAITFGVATDVWLFHSQPGVFALNHLIASTILLMAAPAAPLSGSGRAVGLGLAAGLGLANHQTIALLAPLGLSGILRSLRESERPLRALAAAAGALAVGLTPYLHLIAGSRWGSGWHWGETTGLSGVASHFLHLDLDPVEFALAPDDSLLLTQLEFFATSITADLLYIGALLASVGMGLAIARCWNGSETTFDAGPAWLVGSFLLAGPIFSMCLTVEPVGVDRLLVRRFHLLPELLLSLLAGFAVDWLAHRLDRRSVRTAIAVGLFASGVIAGRSRLADHRDPAGSTYVRDTFDLLPGQAILLGDGDRTFSGALYYQRALERRRDVVYIDMSLLSHRWYTRRIEARLQTELPEPRPTVDTDALLRQLRATERPVFTTGDTGRDLVDSRPSAPYGTTRRLYPPETSAPPPREVARTNVELLDRFALTPQQSPLPGSRRYAHQRDYAQTFRRVAQACRTVDARDLAARAAKTADLFDPAGRTDE